MEEKEANETIADIVAEMRFGLLSATVECEECGEVREQRFRFDGIADRIEAAWKRERDELMSQPRTWEECVDRAMKVKENSDELY